jgi:hypothetical protein
MAKDQPSGQREVIFGIFRVLLCFSLLRTSSTTTLASYVDFDLNTTPLNPTTTGFTITGGTASDQLGYSVSTAGDINNDGYDDIIVGAWGQSSRTGAAYVIYGGPKSSMANIDLKTATLDPATTGFMMTGNATDAWFGFSVSTAGDINHDGYEDIIIGCPQLRTSSLGGGAYVIYGGEKPSMSNIAF